MQDEFSGGTLSGEVEVDETFIGGKARNLHAHKRAKKIKGSCSFVFIRGPMFPSPRLCET